MRMIWMIALWKLCWRANHNLLLWDCAHSGRASSCTQQSGSCVDVPPMCGPLAIGATSMAIVLMLAAVYVLHLARLC